MSDIETRKIEIINSKCPDIFDITGNENCVSIFPNKSGTITVNIYDGAYDHPVTLNRDLARALLTCLEASVYPESVAAERVISGAVQDRVQELCAP